MNTRKTLLLGCGALVALFVGTNVASAALDPVGSFTVRRGAAGAAGTDGKSAYDIWKDAGNTGSEADFLASLVGATGAPGTNGTNGCATTLSKATSTDATTGKKTVTVTAKDCNNNTLWTETVSDGTDGAAGQDGAPGCADEVTVGEKDANGCVPITKTPYSLVNGTCTPGTTESQKVCEPKVCEPVISTTKDASTKCVTYSTQKRKANAAGTACENDGAADTEVVCPLECESHEVSVPCGPAASGASELCEIAAKKGIKTTKYKCDGTTVDGVVYTYDGDDAPDQCEGLSAADKASQIIKTSSVYKRPEGQQGYKEVTTVNCNNVTNTTYEYDPCGEVHAETVTSTVPNCNLTDGNAVMGCTDQTNQTKYYICQKIADSEEGVVPLGAMMEANKDQLQTEINKKLNTTDAESTYLNKTDAGNTYLATANLGTALKDNSVKTDLADAVAGSGALSGYATNASVTSAVAGKADASDLTALSGKVDANTENIDKKLNTADFGTTANTWAGSQTTLAKQADLTTLSGTVSGHTTQIANKLNTADFGTTANSWASTQTTLAKEADLRTVETTANNAATNASSALTTANTASGNATRALNKATTNETNISSLNTTVSGHTTSIGSLQTSVSTNTSSLTSLSNRLNGNCSGGSSESGKDGAKGSTGSSSGIGTDTGSSGEMCGMTIEERIAAIEARLSAAGI